MDDKRLVGWRDAPTMWSSTRYHEFGTLMQEKIRERQVGACLDGGGKGVAGLGTLIFLLLHHKLAYLCFEAQGVGYSTCKL